MTHTFEAIYENGVLVPQSPAALSDGQRVLVHVQLARNSSTRVAERLPDALLTEEPSSAPGQPPRGAGKAVALERTAERLPDGVG